MTSLTIGLLIAEVVLRIFEIGYGNAPLEKDPVYHHVHPSNYEYKMYDPNGEYGGFNVYYDEAGFRVSDRTISTHLTQNRADGIVFLGDSFTEGNQVTYKDTFVSLVGEKLGVPVANLGVSSYSPIIYRLQALNILNNYGSKTVIMQIYSNDFESDRLYSNNAIIIDDNTVAVDGGENSGVITLLRKSYLARFIRKNLLLVGILLKLRDEESPHADKTLQYEQSVFDVDLGNTVSLVSQINDILTAQGKALYVFLIPSKSLTKKGFCCSNDELYLRFYKALNEIGVATIDVADGFESSEIQEDLRFDIDIHLTKSGHKVLANTILTHFESK